ncbi:MAG: hypothetical protein LC135_03585 [Phycisphaerae bacterium]|nr:hypothetical protein [Phycisphaerae bacterium]MCZ2398935.1 hypothetical protein [Phycisphaerae bacterium]
MALAIYNGQLFAGGRFGTAGGQPCRNVARWDGQTWRSLGAGVDDFVRAFAVHNGELIAGGEFIEADGHLSPYWARWVGLKGDLNGDRQVDQEDLAILIASFETDGAGDIDGDGRTDQSDLGIVLAHYGRECP